MVREGLARSAEMGPTKRQAPTVRCIPLWATWRTRKNDATPGPAPTANQEATKSMAEISVPLLIKSGKEVRALFRNYHCLARAKAGGQAGEHVRR